MKKIVCFSLIILLIFCFSIVILSTENIEDIRFNGIVITDKLNIRQGPGTDYNIIGGLNKGDEVNIIAKINDWFIVQTSKNIIGVCNSKYISNLDDYKKSDTIFELVNTKRDENGIKKLQLDSVLCEIAQAKAEDMVKNNYFDHKSPEFGTPFDMLKNNNIEYKTAGENIAGYINEEGVVEAWMNSEGHKENLLSNGYNYTGIGIAESEKYGYIFVQLFIGK